MDLAALSTAGWTHALLLGGWLGLVHAFDADHVATLGGLAAGNRSLSPVGYALRWALGHAAALGAVALAVLGIGAVGVVEWATHAELLVCVALALIGVNALVQVSRARSSRDAQLAAHDVQAARPHVHFLAPFHLHARSRRTRSGRTGILLGVLHGGAGSAGVLALLPLTTFKTGVEIALYLACFSAGVTLGAVAFARVFAAFARRTSAHGERIAAAFQATVGALALCAAGWLLLEVIHGGG